MLNIRRAALFVSASLFTCVGSFAQTASAAGPAPKKVAILIFKDVQIIDYSGPYEAFADAGYDVFTVAEAKDPITTSAGDGQTITPKYTLADAPQADIVVIPGGSGPGVRAVRTDAAVLDWIKRQTVHAMHTMSVCNGAPTLANTGLLDGLTATTTAVNLSWLKEHYPKIKVVSDQRVVDNGKILTAGGLSAGIDGALHVIEVMDGRDVARTVALDMEYDWRPEGGFVRAKMADRMNADPDLDAIGEMKDRRIKGDDVHWELSERFTTKLSASELLGALEMAYQKGYAADGLWAPGSFRMAASEPLAAVWHFNDQKGRHWRGVLKVDANPGDAHQFLVHLTTDQIG
jgi:transcriptional regulator GlxA family with amidase domain